MGPDKKDLSASSSHGEFVVDSSTNDSIATQSNHPLSYDGNAYAPKVRKPYTISKQRERWSEEEHSRFVEALKLYGRAWRQIEEYVGTKTAIQIRSHAQKFFAKVTRDSGGCTEGSLNPDDIPPPRPKKKPTHPYPRKTSTKEVVETNQVENVSFDGDKYSPSSVFSAIGSDNLESTVIEMQKSCNSPTSCATSHICTNTEDGFRIPTKKSSPDDKFPMKFELFPEESESTMDSPYCTSIKLFGKTLMVTDTSQSCELMEQDENSVPMCNQSDLYACEFAPATARFSMENVFTLPWCGWYHPCSSFLSKQQMENVPTGDEIESSRKGFLPYKRCLAERDEISFLEEWDSSNQTAHVCS